jgi:hypothetical protein
MRGGIIKRLTNNLAHTIESIEHNLAIASKTRKIKIGFAIIYASAFPAMPLFQLMKSSSNFEPELVIIPDALRSKDDYLNFISNQTYLLGVSYSIQSGVDKVSGEILDVFSKYDVVCFSSPYPEMVEQLHSITHLSEQGKLVFYINYSFGVSTYDLHWLSSEQLSFLWRAFVPTEFHARRWMSHSLLVKKRIVVTGYPKLESLDPIPKDKSFRKLVILAPHHSIDDSDSKWSLGNFLELCETYAKIPVLFPQVDFVFRPHPLLKSKLERDDIWGKDLTIQYFKKITNLPNVRFSEESDYLELFAKSDALIHNSGSFLAEYLYTMQPAAFLISNKKLLYKSLNKFGRKCLRSHYLLYDLENVIQFITEVVLKELDSKRLKRLRFLKRELQQNNISSSQKIINELNKVLYV